MNWTRPGDRRWTENRERNNEKNKTQQQKQQQRHQTAKSAEIVIFVLTVSLATATSQQRSLETDRQDGTTSSDRRTVSSEQL